MDEKQQKLLEQIGLNYGKLMAVANQIFWAEDEIEQAMARHPEQADRIWHIGLEVMATPVIAPDLIEALHRAHYREIAERWADGADLRPATNAELIRHFNAASLLAPLNTVAVGAYLRLWEQTLPELDLTSGTGATSDDYEKVTGEAIDDCIATMRHKARQPGRVVTVLPCNGLHNGERVDCRYMTDRARADWEQLDRVRGEVA